MNGRFSVIWYTTNIKQFSKKYLTEHTKTINWHSLSAKKSKTKLCLWLLKHIINNKIDKEEEIERMKIEEMID